MSEIKAIWRQVRRVAFIEWSRAGVEHLLSHDTLPVCNPWLLEGDRKLEQPEDLEHFTLLHDDGHRDIETFPDRGMWLKAAGVTNVDPSHGLRFDNAAGA